jgi:molybdopterin-guanine dinucleotide biosynthesis protein B
MLPPVDLVLAESFKREPVARVEVHRSAVAKAFLCARDRRVVAVVGDGRPPRALPRFDLDDIEALADFVVEFARGRRRVASTRRARARARQRA